MKNVENTRFVDCISNRIKHIQVNNRGLWEHSRPLKLSHGKVYNIDVSDWYGEKWAEWHHTTETWGHDEWFKFTRYLDSVNNDVWDAIHYCRTTIKFMGKTPVGFCDRAMTLLGYTSIYSNNAL